MLLRILHVIIGHDIAQCSLSYISTVLPAEVGGVIEFDGHRQKEHGLALGHRIDGCFCSLSGSHAGVTITEVEGTTEGSKAP